MAAISVVYTISHVATILGEDEDWLQELSIMMFPEDGRLFIVGSGRLFARAGDNARGSSGRGNRVARRACGDGTESNTIFRRIAWAGVNTTAPLPFPAFGWDGCRAVRVI
jgi:hypothetical protein